MKKNIFELKINKSESLIVYEKKNYMELYWDSVLAYKNRLRKVKLLEDSFLDHIGAEMYYRVHNMHKLESLLTFTDLLAECMKDNLELGVTRTEPNTFEMDYDFVGCKNLELYLARYQDGYVMLFIKFVEKRNCDLKVKLIKTIFIDTHTFQTWQETIKSEFEQRHVSESGRRYEELEEFFEFMRTPTTDWSKWYSIDEKTSK